MPKYRTTVDGQTVEFEAANDAAAGRYVDAQVYKGQPAPTPEAPAPPPPGGDRFLEDVGTLLGPDETARIRTEARTRGREAGPGVTTGLALQQGVLRNFADEFAAQGAASGLPVGTPPVLSAPVGALRQAFGDRQATQTYEQELARQRGFYEGASETRPVLSTGAEIAGGLVGPFPPGVGTAATTAGQTIARGAGLAALDAAIAGAGAGEDFASRGAGAGTGAAIGGTLGAALPVAGRAAAGARRLLGREEDIGGEAAQAVGQAFRQDMTPAQQAEAARLATVAQRTGQAEELVLGDYGGQAVRDLTRAATNISPEARNQILSRTTPRWQSQAERASQWWGNLTDSPDALSAQARLREAARLENRPAYTRAYQRGEAGVWDDELRDLTSSPTMRAAIMDAERTGADYAAVEGFRAPRNPFVRAEDGSLQLPQGVRPTLQFWDHVQRNLREAAEAQPRGSEGASRINQLRQRLNTRLDTAVPEFGQARRGAAAWFGAEDALEAGRTFMSRPARAGSAEERQAFQRFNPYERQLFAQGVAEDVRNIVRAIPDNRDVGNLFNSPEIRSRLNMALGADRARDLQDYLGIERTMNQFRNALGNSTTAQQLYAIGLIGGASAAGVGYTQGLDLTSSAGIGAALSAGLTARKRNINQRVATRIGQLLTSQDPNDLQQAVRAFQRNAAFRGYVEEIANKLASVTGQQAGGIVGRQEAR